MKYLLLILPLFFLYSCNKSGEVTTKIDANYPTIQNKPLVIISHDASGEFLGYITFNDVSEISSVEISPTKDHSEIYTTTLGTNRHETIANLNSTVYSQTKKGWLGLVKVHLTGGMVTLIEGNGMTSPNPITEKTLAKVEDLISQGIQLYPNDLPIKVNKMDNSKDSF